MLTVGVGMAVGRSSPKSHYKRTAIILMYSLLSGTNFDSAFHKDTGGRHLFIVLGAGICAAVLLWLERSAKKKA